MSKFSKFQQKLRAGSMIIDHDDEKKEFIFKKDDSQPNSNSFLLEISKKQGRQRISEFIQIIRFSFINFKLKNKNAER